MADVFSEKKRSEVMAAIRSKANENTEIKLAAFLRANRITGWRRNQQVFGKPDFIFPKLRMAMFVDGCFWHGCPKHGRKPGSNRSYWLPKLQRNKQRDKEVTKSLRLKGWRVLRVWEHELSNESRIVFRIQQALNGLQTRE
ncbi:MAG: very short patch repair endonuclease [Limisphaerales bacterium]